MANCERCGKLIADGVVFCDNCSSGGATRKTNVISPTTNVLHDDHELFSFKGQHSSNIVTIMKIIPILIGLFSILLGSIFLFPDLVDIAIPPMILPVVVTFLGIIYIFRLSRQSKISSYVFLILMVITITMGSALVFPEYTSLIFAIGTMIESFILIYTVFRRFKKNKIPIFTVTLIIVSIGAGVAFPDYLLTILPVVLVITGVLIVLKF
jgi:hypothetical protein